LSSSSSKAARKAADEATEREKASEREKATERETAEAEILGKSIVQQSHAWFESRYDPTWEEDEDEDEREEQSDLLLESFCRSVCLLRGHEEDLGAFDHGGILSYGKTLSGDGADHGPSTGLFSNKNSEYDKVPRQLAEYIHEVGYVPKFMDMLADTASTLSGTGYHRLNEALHAVNLEREFRKAARARAS